MVGMLKKRIIPKFLIKDGRLFKGVQFHDNHRVAGNAVSTAKVYDSYGVDELIILDTQAGSESRSAVTRIVEDLSKEIFMPLTVGGGIRTLEDIKSLLRAGADKVAINTAALERPSFLREAAETFGNQCIVAAIDYHLIDDQRIVFSQAGRNNTGIEAETWARRAVELGCGEVLLCSIDRDGKLNGYDTDFIKSVSESLSVPVIASSGAGSLQHVAECLDAGASAVTVSSMFFFSDHSPIKLRSYLRSKGYNVRASSSSRN